MNKRISPCSFAIKQFDSPQDCLGDYRAVNVDILTMIRHREKYYYMNNSLSSTDLKKHRQQFPGLANKTYFNFGGQGTMPDIALDAIIDTHKYIQQVGAFLWSSE